MDSTVEVNGTTSPIASIPHGRRNWGRGFLAVCATFALPGLGHFLSGRYKRGGIWLLVALGCQFTGLLLVLPNFTFPALVIGAIGVLLFMAMYVDAFTCSRRSIKSMLGSAAARYATGIGILIGTYFFHPWGAFSAFLVEQVLAGRVRTFSISSGSMTPALSPGDWLIGHRREYLSRWDIVVFNSPHDATAPYVARIAGLPGETVEIKDGSVVIGGHVEESPPGLGPYISYPYSGERNDKLAGNPGAGCEGNPIRLGQDEYFLLGDNSARALDARLWEAAFPDRQLGATPMEQILYRASAIYWPPNRWRTFPSSE